MPDSMIDVETSTSASPRRKPSMRSSSCFSSICPCATANVSSGHSARRRSAVSSMSSTRLCRKNAWPAARVLALERLLDELLVVLADVGLDRAAALGRRLDHEMSRRPARRHLQRARDRRRAHRDHVDLELELAQQLLLLDAEALLLVDDQQPEVLRAHVAARAARWVPMRMSTLPSVKRLTASRCSAAGAEAATRARS